MGMTAEEFAKLVDSKAGANLSFDEWLELDKEAHKLSHEEFDKFCETGSGRIFGDRINLIKSIKADIDNRVYIVDPNDPSKLIDISKCDEDT
jgi:hypothetical protein